MSDRIQRRIDQFLDEADEASARSEWERVRDRALNVLALDRENADAQAYLEAAAFRLKPEPEPGGVETQPGNAAGLGDRPAPEQADRQPQLPSDGAGSTPAGKSDAQTVPASFVNGRYRVIRPLGEGGKKRVFLCHDALLDRQVAFALIKTEGLDEEGRQRVLREAQAMGKLGEHPHLMQIFDLGEEPAPPGSGQAPFTYMTLPLMPGGDVEGLLEKAPEHRLSLNDTLAIGRGVCRGLAFAHSRGIVHRDLKPGNVWLASPQTGTLPERDAVGVAKIGDFGLAVTLDRSRLTRAGMMVGTPLYMAPEQALGVEATPRSDLYSLGAMLYEMVAGRPPFMGEDAIGVISQHINTSPVAPSWHNPACPSALEDLILHLLAKAPEDRPATAGEVLAALEAIDPDAPTLTAAHENPLERLARGVFVGRDRELARLRSGFDAAFGGQGHVAMLVGEPGIGKTRTALEVETYARLRGAQVLWGRAHEAAGAPPYWPWVQALRTYVAGTDPAVLRSQLGSEGPEVARIVSEVRERLPGLPEPAPAIDAETAQFRLLDAVTTFLRNASAVTPLLIVLDDLHWADRPTLLLLQHVAREIGRARIMLLGTYRDVEVGRAHPLAATLADLAREQLFQRVLLRGLSREEVESFIRASANLDPARDLLQAVYEETEGNPFFLGEVVALMAQEGTLSRTARQQPSSPGVTGDSGRSPSLVVTIPQSVREVLGRRLDRLSDECNDLLRLAAVAGREFTYDLLGALSASDGSTDDEHLLQLVEEALQGRVIQETERRGEYRFTHALIQETLLGEVSTTRRVRLHGRLAETLEQLYGSRAERQAAELAHHFVESATLTRRHARQAAHYSRLAAEQAEAQTAWDEAARHYKNCLELALEAEDRLGQDEAVLLEGYGKSAWYAGEGHGDLPALQRALELYRDRGDGLGAARVTLLLVLSPDRISTEQRSHLTREALSGIGDADPHLEALLLTYVHPFGPGVGEAKAATERARQLALEHGLMDVEFRLMLADAVAARNAGRIDEAVERGYAALAAFRRSGALHPLGVPGVLVPLLIAAGRLDEAERVAEETAAHFRRVHIRPNEVTHLARIAEVALLRGHLDRIDSMAPQMPPRDPFLHWCQVLATRKEIAEEYPAAFATLPSMEDLRQEEILPGPRPGPLVTTATSAAIVTLTRAAALGALARVAFNAGDRTSARAAFEAWGELVLSLPAVSGLSSGFERTLRPFVYLDDGLPGLGNREQVEAGYVFLKELDGWRFGGGRCLDRIRGSWALHLGLLDEAEGHLRAGLEITERERCPIEQGRCLQGLADLAEARGNRAAAAELLDRAGGLFRQHGAALYLRQVLAKRQLLHA